MAAMTRTKRPEVKIPVRDFNDLTTYCKGTEGNTPTKIICTLVRDFLDREDVKSVIAAQGKTSKKLVAIEKRKATIEKLKAEIEALEKGI